MAPNKYKMCDFANNCRNGTACRFAHNINQLHPSKRPAKPKAVYKPPVEKVKRDRVKKESVGKKVALGSMFDSDSDSDDETVVAHTIVDMLPATDTADTASDDDTVVALTLSPVTDTEDTASEDQADEDATTTPASSILTALANIPGVLASIDTATGKLCVDYDGQADHNQIVAAIDQLGYGVQEEPIAETIVLAPVGPPCHSMSATEEDAEDDKLYRFQMKSLALEKQRKARDCMTYADAIAKCYEYRNLVRCGKAPSEPWHLASDIGFEPHERKLIHEMATDCRLFTSSFTNRFGDRVVSMQHVPFVGQ